MGDTCSGRRFFATACFFGELTVLCAPAAFSQTLTTGDIDGVVKEDARGAVVPSAIVTLKFRSEIRACPVCGAVAKFQTF
jgi:hypothetical protein